MEFHNQYFNILNKEIKLSNYYVIANDFGNWVALRETDFKNYKSNCIDKPLQLFLKKNNILITKNNKDKAAISLRKNKPQLFQATSLHIIITSLRCNLSCTYCHSAARSISVEEKDMTIDTAKKTVDFIFQSPSKFITIVFQGGEPLLNIKVIKFIVKYSKEKNNNLKKDLKFVLVSNLTLLKDEDYNYFTRNNILLNTTLDGPEFVHNINRKNKNQSGSYKQVIKSIKKIKDRNGTVNALMVTSKHSLKHYKNIVDEYISLGLNKIFIRPLNELGYAKNNLADISYSSDEYISFWKNAINYIYTKKDIYETFSFYLVQKFIGKSQPMFLDLMSPCGAIIGQLSYNYDGTIYSCDLARMTQEEIFNLGNVRTTTFNKIIKMEQTKEIIKSSVNDNSICNLCAFQAYCGLCPVYNYSKNSSIIPIISRDDRCHILKSQFEFILDKLLNDKSFYEKFKKISTDLINPSTFIYNPSIISK